MATTKKSASKSAATKRSAPKKKAVKKAAGSKALRSKVRKIMREYKGGKLHSGSRRGPTVRSRKQAVAIALSEAGASQRRTSSARKSSKKKSGSR